MNSISAKIIADSLSPYGPRLTTMQLQFPRFVLPEFNTHRVFSRNAQSTRAVPTQRLIDQVRNDPFIPLVWGLNQSGMQAFSFHTNPATCKEAWLAAASSAVDKAEKLVALGLHKQIVGRVVEPFTWTRVVVSSTSWDNFFALRDHPAAEPHMQMLARAMKTALSESTPEKLRVGEWHLPYVMEDEKYHLLLQTRADPIGVVAPRGVVDLIKLSVARCASVSYKTVEGEPMTFERATALHDKLVSAVPPHASPMEHVAQVDGPHYAGVAQEKQEHPWLHPEQHRNFTGFRQYRAMVEA